MERKKRKKRRSLPPLLSWWDFSSLPPVLITVCAPAVDGCGRYSREMLFCSSFFFFFLAGSICVLYILVARCWPVCLRYPPFTHTCCYTVDYVMGFFFSFPRSVLLIFFLIFAGFFYFFFYYYSPIDRYHTHALRTLCSPGQWTHPAG